ncbi:uncharacterized protein PFL1_01522 [Pseudozyma flocculosa PF-1]|uniref:Uncharacterized protein n=1 Tax=Pseudozyma flocculosa TaxID=84751 RepID=A0A5C3FBI3_9BASI|nr:uncharacterized protein PFL1_01522 [Pseudozyma flocculosa PF-1]EPQ31338.1 hypothetical protein PFL1_01522 [Pseudozyma flocculosa PF-1]SPO41803.1 uncharacterized protein PSFLO_07285 [Pseudozyma flocculosa]
MRWYGLLSRFAAAMLFLALQTQAVQISIDGSRLAEYIHVLSTLSESHAGTMPAYRFGSLPDGTAFVKTAEGERGFPPVVYRTLREWELRFEDISKRRGMASPSTASVEQAEQAGSHFDAVAEPQRGAAPARSGLPPRSRPRSRAGASGSESAPAPPDLISPMDPRHPWRGNYVSQPTAAQYDRDGEDLLPYFEEQARGRNF